MRGKVLGQGEEIVRRPVARAESSGDKSSIGTVEESLFSALERKSTPDLLTGLDWSRHHHVGAKMHMLMPVEMGRWLSIEPDEFIKLVLENCGENLAERWTVEDLGISAAIQKTDNPIVFRS